MLIWNLQIMQVNDFCIKLARSRDGLTYKLNDVGILGIGAEVHAAVVGAMHPRATVGACSMPWT
jgi:hypothetical protein